MNKNETIIQKIEGIGYFLIKDKEITPLIRYVIKDLKELKKMYPKPDNK